MGTCTIAWVHIAFLVPFSEIALHIFLLNQGIYVSVFSPQIVLLTLFGLLVTVLYVLLIRWAEGEGIRLADIARGVLAYLPALYYKAFKKGYINSEEIVPLVFAFFPLYPILLLLGYVALVTLF